MRKFSEVDYVFDEVALGIAVRERRTDLGMTQPELAAIFGYTGNWVSKIECAAGELSLGMRDFLRICNFLDLHPYDYFVTEDSTNGIELFSGWQP